MVVTKAKPKIAYRTVDDVEELKKLFFAAGNFCGFSFINLTPD